MAILKCTDLSFAYDGRTVLDGVNFEISQKDYLCIVGENGSGKSTLMKGLLGLKQPQSGSLSPRRLYPPSSRLKIQYRPMDSGRRRSAISRSRRTCSAIFPRAYMR